MQNNSDDKFDKALESYEKGVENFANKTEKTFNTVGRGANRLTIGCTIIFANLFFAAFCLWGVYAAYQSYTLTSTGETTTGTVIEMEESTSEGSCCVYSPVIQFQANNQTYTFESNNASDPPEYQVGDQVQILYNPANPNQAQINKFSEQWLMPLCLIPSMIIASLILTFSMIRAWRRNTIIEI